MKDFRELKVWQKAHQLVVELYRHSAHLPAEERFGLTAPLRKTAVPIPSNSAEGCGREGDRELTRCLNIASGSAAELDDPLLLARDLAYLPADVHRELDPRVSEVKRRLYRFIQSLADA